MPDFDWPCDRRVAHHPHTVESHDEWCDANGCRCGRCPCSCSGTWECPGVDAHPATQIGGHYPEGTY